jgi:hypothetical protein
MSGLTFYDLLNTESQYDCRDEVMYMMDRVYDETGDYPEWDATVPEWVTDAMRYG